MNEERIKQDQNVASVAGKEEEEDIRGKTERAGPASFLVMRHQ